MALSPMKNFMKRPKSFYCWTIQSNEKFTLEEYEAKVKDFQTDKNGQSGLSLYCRCGTTGQLCAGGA